MAFEVRRRKPENGVNMALKCEICGEKIEANFLEKIFGTYVGRGKKKKAVCNNCQKKYGDKVKEMVK